VQYPLQLWPLWQFDGPNSAEFLKPALRPLTDRAEILLIFAIAYSNS
jgi:hypothetical protein